MNDGIRTRLALSAHEENTTGEPEPAKWRGLGAWFLGRQ